DFHVTGVQTCALPICPFMPRTGGQILIDQLLVNGVDRVFCVPGESYLGALDALYEARNRIQLVICRQEGGAAYMAEADGKMTGQSGRAAGRERAESA